MRGHLNTDVRAWFRTHDHWIPSSTPYTTRPQLHVCFFYVMDETNLNEGVCFSYVMNETNLNEGVCFFYVMNETNLNEGVCFFYVMNETNLNEGVCFFYVMNETNLLKWTLVLKCNELARARYSNVATSSCCLTHSAPCNNFLPRSQMKYKLNMITCCHEGGLRSNCKKISKQVLFKRLHLHWDIKFVIST